MARPKGVSGGTVYYDEANNRFKWSVRYTDEDGRVVRRESAVKVGHAETKKRALELAEKKAWAAVRKALDDKGKQTDDLTLSEWRDYARKHCFKNLKPRAKISQDRIMERYIIPLLGDVRIIRLTAEHVDTLLEDGESRGLAYNTCRNIRNVLSVYLNHAVKRRKIPYNPVCATEVKESLPRAQEKRWFDPAECKALLKAAEGKRVYGPILTGLLLGLRVGEVAGLKWEDIDFEAGIVKVRRQVQRYNGKLREELPKSRSGITDLPLPRALERYLREHPTDSVYLFPNVSGGAWEPATIYREMMACCKAAKLLDVKGKPNPCFHSLRTTYVTLGNRAAVSIKAKQAAARHSTYDVTLDVYTQLMDDELRTLTDHIENAIA